MEALESLCVPQRVHDDTLTTWQKTKVYPLTAAKRKNATLSDASSN